MRYFFDTEFNENVHPIDLISIGIVADDNREWYGIHRDYVRYPIYEEMGFPAEDFPIIHSCNDWVKKNVLPVMFTQNGEGKAGVWFTGDSIKLRDAVIEFVGNDPHPEFWAYYGDYDWFLLTRLFKTFEKMPKPWPQVCYDVHQYARHHGAHRALPPKFKPEHNALVDARWTKQAFYYVKKRVDDLVDVREKVIWP